MPRPLPPLNLLIGFEAVARCLSFTKAAEEVFLSQSAISRQIRKLEEYLGFTLFERHHRSICLTEHGRILYESVQASLSNLAGTIESVKRELSQDSLKVTMTTSFASLWLVPRLNHFRAAHPEIALHIEADNRIVDLNQGKVDLAIRYCSPEAVRSINHIHFAQEEIFPVCSPKLLNDLRNPLKSLSDLSNHTLLHLCDTQNTWPWLQWSNWLKNSNSQVSLSKSDYRFSHFDQMIQAATRGQGIALGSSPLVDHLLEEGILVEPFDIRLPSPRSFYLCNGITNVPSVARFSDWIQKALISSRANTIAVRDLKSSS